MRSKSCTPLLRTPVFWSVAYLVFQAIICFLLWVTSPNSGGYVNLLVGLPPMVAIHLPYIDALNVKYTLTDYWGWGAFHHLMFFVGLFCFCSFGGRFPRFFSATRFIYVIYYGVWALFMLMILFLAF